jgi:hypothetical protein
MGQRKKSKMKKIIFVFAIVLLLSGCMPTSEVVDHFIEHDILMPGEDFYFLFNIDNKMADTFYLGYEYNFNPSCLEIYGNQTGILFIDNFAHNPFYTRFYILEDLSIECYYKEQVITLRLINYGTDKVITIEDDFWIPAEATESQLQKIERYRKFTAWE